eukprot:GEMP01050790.1.p1 GENE.GEMP01050790.1~~GEMP01050790.1.p1  ORF type:complete len:311 (+),score=48.72 GEMP01050790.1:111-1043(+)
MFSACSSTKRTAPRKGAGKAPPRHHQYDTERMPYNDSVQPAGVLGCGTPRKPQGGPHPPCHLPDPIINEIRHAHNDTPTPSFFRGCSAPDSSERARPRVSRRVERQHLPDHHGLYEAVGPYNPYAERNMDHSRHGSSTADSRFGPTHTHEMICYEAQIHQDGTMKQAIAQRFPGDTRPKARPSIEDMVNARSVQYAGRGARSGGEQVDRYINEYYTHQAPAHPTSSKESVREPTAMSGKQRIVSTAFPPEIYARNRKYNYGEAVRRGMGDNSKPIAPPEERHAIRRNSATTWRCHEYCGGRVQANFHEHM